MVSPVQAAVYCGMAWLLWKLLRRYLHRTTFENLPGPRPHSFLTGAYLYAKFLKILLLTPSPDSQATSAHSSIVTMAGHSLPCWLKISARLYACAVCSGYAVILCRLHENIADVTDFSRRFFTFPMWHLYITSSLRTESFTKNRSGRTREWHTEASNNNCLSSPRTKNLQREQYDFRPRSTLGSR